MKSAIYSLALLFPVLCSMGMSNSLHEQMDQIASLQESQIQMMLTQAGSSNAVNDSLNLTTQSEIDAVITSSLKKLATADAKKEIVNDLI